MAKYTAPRLSGTNTRFVFMFLKWWACGVCNVFKAEYPFCLMLSIKSNIYSIAKYMICVCNNRILYYWFDYMVDFIVILVTISIIIHMHTRTTHMYVTLLQVILLHMYNVRIWCYRIRGLGSPYHQSLYVVCFWWWMLRICDWSVLILIHVIPTVYSPAVNRSHFPHSALGINLNAHSKKKEKYYSIFVYHLIGTMEERPLKFISKREQF